jgi:hypothetical protein
MGMGVEVGVSLGLGRGGLDMGASVVGHDGGFGIGISLDDGLHGPEAEHAAQYEGSMMASLGELSGFYCGTQRRGPRDGTCKYFISRRRPPNPSTHRHLLSPPSISGLAGVSLRRLGRGVSGFASGRHIQEFGSLAPADIGDDPESTGREANPVVHCVKHATVVSKPSLSARQ